MIGLVKQLSKLLLLVFNLPAVLQLFTTLFKVEQKNGKIELGIVNIIAQTLAQQDLARLTQGIEEGKQQQLEELEAETQEAIDRYSSMGEEGEFFIQQALARRSRRLAEIEEINPQDILTDDFIQQSIEAKKRQLEPSLVPALTPITSFLGIPTMALKLQEYIPGFDPPGLTDQEAADDVANSFDIGAGIGEVFTGPVGEGDLEVQFNGIETKLDFALRATNGTDDRVEFTVLNGQSPYDVRFVDYGPVGSQLGPSWLSFVWSITKKNTFSVVLDVEYDRLISQLLESFDVTFDEEIKTTVYIRDVTGKSSTIKIPTLLSTEN